MRTRRGKAGGADSETTESFTIIYRRFGQRSNRRKCVGILRLCDKRWVS